ncbi:MAG: LapA family protein [Actinomycetota bacterium]|nr:LapA family protein [Actinomycetota bacterium]
MSDQSGGSGLSVGGFSLTGRRIIGIIIGVIALIFVFSNTGEVTLKFLWLDVSAPGWLMLLILLLAGFLVGFMIGRKRYKDG